MKMGSGELIMESERIRCENCNLVLFSWIEKK